MHETANLIEVWSVSTAEVEQEPRHGPCLQAAGWRMKPKCEETKDCWKETGGEFYNPIRFRWVPVRAGTIRRVSAYMTNRLLDGNELQVYPVWRAAGSPCPSYEVGATSAAVTLTGGANIGHSALLSQALGDDYLLGVRLGL